MKLRSITLGLALLILSACSRTPTEPVVVEVEQAPLPATVNEPWAEPMVDSIKVPGKIDPSGVYYRAPHNTIVEIRPGHYKEVEYGD